MLNNVILVGRVVEEPKLIKLDSGYVLSNFTLAIQKPFRNENNEYETDFVPVQTWMNMAEVLCDYVGKGSIIGCRCRLSTRVVEVNDIKVKAVEVVAERIAFISIKERSDKPSIKKGYDKVKKDIVTMPLEENSEEEKVSEDIGLDLNDLNTRKKENSKDIDKENLDENIKKDKKAK